MKIALAQINNTIGNIDGNTEKIITTIKNAEDNNIDLLIFPELAITGRNCRDLFFEKDFINAQTQAIETIKNNISKTNIIIGAITGEKNEILNSAILINKKDILTLSIKNDLTLDEQKYFKRKNLFKTIKIKDKVFAVNLNEQVANTSNIDILINLESKHFDISELEDRFGSKNTCKTEIFVNLTGINDQLIYDGKSYILNNNGKIILLGKSREEDFIIFDTENEYKQIVQPKYVVEEEIFNTLSFGLKDFCEKTGLRQVVLGLSGGIDSALTAVIAQHALGSENVLGIKMPSKFSSEGSITDSDKLAQNIGIETKEIPINPLFNTFIDDIQQKSYNDLAEENIQSRFRGLILMSYSNRENRLLLSTGNKSEAAMGYCTLYGDTCGGLNLIVDLYKTQVYAISKWLNKDKKVIPVEIIEKAPSAELRPNQKDQDSLPEYNVLDDVLYRIIEKQESIEEISKFHNEELVKDIFAKYKKAEFKRKQACLGFKVSKRSLSVDVDYPIVKG